MKKLLVKKGTELTDEEITEINLAKKREFKVPPMKENQKTKTQFFLLMEEKRILAVGELIPIEPIKFNAETFFVLGIGGIVANEKRRGYGREIMNAIKDYLKTHDKTGVGSCGLRNKGFYSRRAESG